MNQPIRQHRGRTRFNVHHLALFRDFSEEGRWPAKAPAAIAERIGLTGLSQAVLAQPLDRKRLRVRFKTG